ncbi:hypothetical protein Tco_0598864 [Tanacetum coccineum]
MKVEESLNLTFDESPPPTKLSTLVDDDVGEEEAIIKNTKVVNNNNKEEDDSITLSKQKSAPHSEQPVEDVPIPDGVNISDSEDTDTAHLPKIKTKLDLLKPIPEEDRPATPKPDWVIELLLSFFNAGVQQKPFLFGGSPGKGFLTSQGHSCPPLMQYSPISHADSQSRLQCYKILEADFKNMHPNDFEDLYLLHLQVHLNHLSGADKVHLFNAVNLIGTFSSSGKCGRSAAGLKSLSNKTSILHQPDWDDLTLFKEDYTIVSKPRAVIYRDRNDQKKMMRETEVHKFSDGTLNRILDKLDHMVKDFKLFKYNPGMETRIWLG